MSTSAAPWPAPVPWGASLSSLLDQTRIGVIHLDWRGRLLEANDSARDLLRQGQRLDGARRLPGRPTGPTTTPASLACWPRPCRRAPRRAPAAPCRSGAGSPRAGLVLHVHPMTVRQMDLGVPEVGALVLVEDLDRPVGLDAERVGSVLGLTATREPGGGAAGRRPQRARNRQASRTRADFGQDARQEHAPQAGGVAAAGPGSPGCCRCRRAPGLRQPALRVQRGAGRPPLHAIFGSATGRL